MAQTEEQKRLWTETLKAALAATEKAKQAGTNPQVAARKAAAAVISAATPQKTDWVQETAKQLAPTTGKDKYKATTTDDNLVDTTKAMARDQQNSPKAKAYEAEKEHQDYLKSEEYKQSIAEQEKKVNQDRIMQGILTGNADIATPAVVQNDKELRLRNAAQQARSAVDAEADAKVMSTDLTYILSMTPEERRQLEQYAVGRDVDYFNTLNFAQNGIQVGTAEKNAADLIAKYGQKRVDELAESYSRAQNARTTEAVAAAGQKHGNEHAFIGSAASVGANALGGLMGTMDYAKNLGRYDNRYKTLDPNAMGNLGSVYASAVRGQVQQNIEGEDPGFWRKVGSIAYQGVMSTADSIARAYLGGGAFGGAALAATNTFSQTMADASKAGATPAEAALLATTTAGIEALSEKIPLDNLIKTAGAGKQNAFQIVKTALMQAGIEATTEEISLIGTVLAEAAILGEKSDYQQRIAAEMAKGMTQEQAAIVASKDLWNEAVNTALVSMVSGGASSVAGSVKANIGAAMNEKAADKAKDIKQEALDKVRSMNQQGQAETESTEQPKVQEQADFVAATAEEAAQKNPTQPQEAPKTEAQRHVDAAAAEVFAKNTEEQNRLKQAQEQTAKQAAEKQRQKEVYEDLKAAKTEKVRLEKEIQKAEKKLKETGKGSPARINQLKAQLEQQNDLVRQIESQYTYFTGDYEKTVQEAVQRQTAIFEEARKKAVQAIADHEAGKITDAQLKAANDAYNAAGAELYRLKHTTQDQYRAELAEVGLVADREMHDPAVVAKNATTTETTQASKTEAAEAKQEKRETALPKAPYRKAAEEASAETGKALANKKNPKNSQKTQTETFEKSDTVFKKETIAETLRNSGKKAGFKYEGYVVRKYSGGSYNGNPYFSYRIDAPNGDVLRGETAYYNDAFFEAVAEEIENHHAVISGANKKQSEQLLTEVQQPNPVDTSKQETTTAQPRVDSAVETVDNAKSTVAPQQSAAPKTVKSETAAATEQPKTENGQKLDHSVAAERNFTGKAAYQELLSDQNSQPDRPGDVRPMEVPKKDSLGRRVSEVVAYAYGAEITTDKMANTIEELVQEGALGFDTRNNQESLNTAAEAIKQKGVGTTKNEIVNAAEKGKIKDGDIEKAILLYAMYNSKNTDAAIDNASDVMVALAKMANITGRNLQMFKLLRQMTPEGQLMTIKKNVQKNVDSLTKAGQVKSGYSPEIDPELMEEYRKAAGENMRAVSEKQKTESAEKMQIIMDAIYKIEASKIPASFKAKWDAWRYMSMLGNVKTQVRNVAGNALMMPYKVVKDRAAALGEKIFIKDKNQRTKSLVTDPELLAWARQDSKSAEVNDALKYSAKLGDDVSSQKFREDMQIFNTKALDNVRKFVESVPGAGDMLFKNGYYARSLADFLRARGYKAADVTGGKVSAEVLNEARSYAIQEAMKATFNDSNIISDFFATELRYKGENPLAKVMNTALEGVLPFRKTPANIIARFTEYSPVGIAKGLWQTADHLVTGKTTAATAVDSLASGLTGTVALQLGYALASGMAGFKLTGSGTDEDEKRQGHQDYALEFRTKDGQEHSYKIDWAAPANLPLFVGANIYQSVHDSGEDADLSKFTAFLRGMGNALEPLLSLSCLSGVNDLVESTRYAEEGEALYTIAAKIATGYFTQGIPALTRQAAQAVPKSKQVTFANSADPTIRDLQYTVADIPGVGAAFKTDKVNAWGEKETERNWMVRAFNAFVNPGTGKKIDNSTLEQELTRLNNAQENSVTPPTVSKVISYTDRQGNLHKDYRLTEEEYQTIAKTQGQTARNLLERMTNSANYKALTDDQKAKAWDMVYSYAKEKARVETLKTAYSEDWMMSLKPGSEADTILRRITDNAFTSAISKVTAAWANNYSPQNTRAYAKQLDTAYQSYSKMSAFQKEAVKETATGLAADYIEARENGISNDVFLETLKDIKKLQPEPEQESVRAIQKAEAVAGKRGLSEDQKEVLVKQQLSDAQDKNLDDLQDMGYDVETFVQLYRDYEDFTSGTGKKNRTIQKWMKDYGLSNSAAKAIYEVFQK